MHGAISPHSIAISSMAPNTVKLLDATTCRPFGSVVVCPCGASGYRAAAADMPGIVGACNTIDLFSIACTLVYVNSEPSLPPWNHSYDLRRQLFYEFLKTGSDQEIALLFGISNKQLISMLIPMLKSEENVRVLQLNTSEPELRDLPSPEHERWADAMIAVA